ncbi:hypothetical protein BJX64DRAFT_110582 [Aspergillus heterothallicus]
MDLASSRVICDWGADPTSHLQDQNSSATVCMIADLRPFKLLSSPMFAVCCLRAFHFQRILYPFRAWIVTPNTTYLGTCGNLYVFRFLLGAPIMVAFFLSDCSPTWDLQSTCPLVEFATTLGTQNRRP